MSIELKKLQDMVYSIFKEFDRICTQNDIHYSMEGGTLLGAVKYGDFVPWDDDIDVVMERSQYENFCRLLLHNWMDGFFCNPSTMYRNFR